MEEQETPLNKYKCVVCGGRGKIYKTHMIIHRHSPSWMKSAPDINNEKCSSCKGSGIIWK